MSTNTDIDTFADNFVENGKDPTQTEFKLTAVSAQKRLDIDELLEKRRLEKELKDSLDDLDDFDDDWEDDWED